MRKLSFVIPCYCSENTISKVIDDIVNTIKNEDDYEVICVNDCSKDNVMTVLKGIAKDNKKVKVVDLAKNVGQHNAIMCGFRNASGDIVICLDDDGQTDPSQCYKIIDALDENTDIVFAKYDSIRQNIFRKFGTFINRRMSNWLLGMPKGIVTNSYFACKKYIIDEVIKYNNPYTFLSGLFFRTTHKVKNVDIVHKSRISGSSGYSFMKLFSLWMNGFTAFSIKPLRISSYLGFVCAFLGFIFGIYQIVMKFISPNRQLGYSSIMCVILFIGGMIMIMLGLIGEYIGRIYICINNSPQYVIKERINFDE